MTSDGDRHGDCVATNQRASKSDPAPLRTDGGSQPLFDRSLREFPWGRAILAAVGTVVAEYLLVATLFVVGPSSVDRGSPTIRSQSDVLIQYAHVLFNAHHVPILTRSTEKIAGSALANDLYLAENPAIPPAVFFLIPMAALAIAGGLFERWRSAERIDPSRAREGLLVGTGFSIGYLVVGIVGSLSLVLSWPLVLNGEQVGRASQAPYLWIAIVAFFLFPVVFASIGAILVYPVHEGIEGSTDERDGLDSAGSATEGDQGSDGDSSESDRDSEDDGDESGVGPTRVVSRVEDDQA